jgi:two-component system, LuxR family, response regulator FixJ
MGRTANSHGVVGIVDDDQAVRDALCNLLASVGFAATAFSSAEELIESSQSTKLDCLILDVRLPGMSGPELQHRLTEGRNIIPVIFITANADHRVRKRALENGAAAFFYKPIHSEALLDALRATLS